MFTAVTLTVLAESSLAADGARAIQLAMTPVFLLTGIAGLLNVMTGRLSRVIDRGRLLTEGVPFQITIDPAKRAVELLSLERRRRLASTAITACTLGALLICMVIVLLFGEVLLDLRLIWLEGFLFTGSTVALVVGLAYFLREVHLATFTVRIETEFSLPAPPPPAAIDTPQRESGS